MSPKKVKKRVNDFPKLIVHCDDKKEDFTQIELNILSTADGRIW